MNRFSLILIFMIWLSWSPSVQGQPAFPTAGHLLGLLLPMAVALLALGVWSRAVANRLTGLNVARDMRKYNQVTRFLRLLIPLWFAVGVFFFAWPELVQRILRPLHGIPVELPATLIGISPPLLALILMWCATYPAERALREQTLLDQFDANLPVHIHPTFWQYLSANIRLQILFMLVPVACILAVRDLLSLGLYWQGIPRTDWWELTISLAALIPVTLLSPVLLVRILPTDPLPDSPLRQRLEELCREQGLKVNNVLLWKTHSHIGNAAVMGVLPGMRYLLVTDLVLETMPDEQILAVFAHEIGHVKHHHLWWLGACAACFMFLAAGPGQTLWRLSSRYITLGDQYTGLISLLISAPAFYYLFGYVSRRFERQADVFAARSVTQMLPQLVGEQQGPQEREMTPPTHVQPAGAHIVCDALYRIAAINNVPIRANEWLHGSIAWRMDFLTQLSCDETRTHAFDALMRRVYWTIVTLVLVFGTWTIWESLR